MLLTPEIPERDVKVITQIVELFSNEGYDRLKFHLLKIFGKDITPDHYITLGGVLGIKATTDLNRAKKQTIFKIYENHN